MLKGMIRVASEKDSDTLKPAPSSRPSSISMSKSAPSSRPSSMSMSKSAPSSRPSSVSISKALKIDRNSSSSTSSALSSRLSKRGTHHDERPHVSPSSQLSRSPIPSLRLSKHTTNTTSSFTNVFTGSTPASPAATYNGVDSNTNGAAGNTPSPRTTKKNISPKQIGIQDVNHRVHVTYNEALAR